MTSGRLFFGALAAVTLLPMIGLPILAFVAGSSDGAFPVIATLITWVATAHIASTAYYYWDPQYRPLIRANRKRFVLPLLALPVTFITILVVSRPIATVLYAAFFTWQLYHVGRQNYGMVALASASTKHGSIPKPINFAMTLSALAGAAALLAIPSTFARGTQPELILTPLVIDGLQIAAPILMALSIGLVVATLIVDAKLRKNARMTTFCLAGPGMFVGMTMFASVGGLFLCGITHALQYLLVTGVAAKGNRWGLVAMMLLTLPLTWLFLHLYQSNLGYQIFLGLFAVHFLADAKIWRLREPVQRGIVKSRFSFLFA